MDLYWFIPALVKSRVGSESGTTEDEGTHSSQYDCPSNIYFDIDTKSVPILLEILQKCVADLDRRPLDVLIDDRSHIRGSASCGAK